MILTNCVSAESSSSPTLKPAALRGRMPNMEDGTLGIPMEYIVNHVFLPPKLPQLCDTTPEVEVALTKLLHDALNEFIGLLPEEVQHEWIALPHMLSILLDTGSLGSPIRNLDRELDGMVEGGAYLNCGS